MNKQTLEKDYLGRVVKITLHDNEEIFGRLVKSEMLNNLVNTYLCDSKYYTLLQYESIYMLSVFFRVSHIKKIRYATNAELENYYQKGRKVCEVGDEL